MECLEGNHRFAGWKKNGYAITYKAKQDFDASVFSA